MTRGEFMIKMLESIFGTKYIEFQGTENSKIKYAKSGTLYKDCTYSHKYKGRFLEILQKLFDDKYKEISVEKIHSISKPIAEYHKKAIDFIFSLKGIKGLNSYTIDALKRSMTISMVSQIYQEIIIETIFCIGNQNIGKERHNDNFDESIDKICDLILRFIYEQLPELSESEYKNAFFRELVKTYPLFSELHLEEDNKIVQLHLQREEKYTKLTFRHRAKSSYIDYDMFQRMDLIETYIQDSNELGAFSDKKVMTEEDFLDLDFKLDTLLLEVLSYPAIFKNEKEKVLEFKNVAVRVYNFLYGKGHPKYEDDIYLAAWNAHVRYVDYLFWLSDVLEWYDEEEKRQKEQ